MHLPIGLKPSFAFVIVLSLLLLLLLHEGRIAAVSENLGARGGELMCGVRQDCGWRAGARGGAEVRRREGHRVEVRDGRARGLIVYLYGYYYYYTRGASHE